MKKKIIKISCAILAIFLIFFIINIYYETAGNPISKIIISKKAQEYVKKTYPSFELNLSKPSYNSKDNQYSVACTSNLGPDLYFEIYFYPNGEFINDTYEPKIKNNSHTFDRLHDLYAEDINNILKSTLNYNYVYITSDLWRVEDIPLNWEYDLHTKKLDIDIGVCVATSEISIDSFKKILLDVDEVLTLNDINVREYTMYLIEPFSNEKEKKQC